MRAQRAHSKNYSQPAKASWHEFLHWKRWTPLDVDELPDGFVFMEFSIYRLKLKYSIPLE